jgi:hypothetical protein
MLFRQAGAALGGYLLWPGVVRSQPQLLSRAKNCIFVLLRGGPSQVDTFDLKVGRWTPASVFEPTSFGELAMPRGLFPQLCERRSDWAVVRSAQGWAVAHTIGQDWLEMARNPQLARNRFTPHIGSVVARELSAPDAVLPAFFALNSASTTVGRGYFPARYAPFYTSPAGDGLVEQTEEAQAAYQRRLGLLLQLEDSDFLDRGVAAREMDTFYQASRRLLANPDIPGLFTFSEEERTRYGRTSFGNSCLAARNLLTSGLGARFVQITFDGWDDHVLLYVNQEQGDTFIKRCRQLDTALGALLDDLREAAILDETLIVAMGEMGRTAGDPNGQGGRDHWQQQFVWFGGAGVRGGRAIGRTDASGSDTVEFGWRANRVVRPEDVAATIYSALGIDWTKKLDDNPGGGGFEYIPHGDGYDYLPLDELWA